MTIPTNMNCRNSAVVTAMNGPVTRRSLVAPDSMLMR